MATITPRLSKTESHLGYHTTPKNYSFLNSLDDIANYPATLALGPSSSHDDTVKGLSAGLHMLTYNKGDSRHTPEMPLPSYDNGNVTIRPATSPQSRKSSKRVQTSTMPASNRADLSPLPQFNFGEPLSFMNCFSTAPGDVSRQSSHTGHQRRQDFSRHLPYSCLTPMSMYSTSTERGYQESQHASTGSPEASTRRPGRREKVITFDDQRYTLPHDRESKPNLVSQPHRRRLRIVTSFKDLHNKPEKKARTQKLEPNSAEASKISMLTLREALHGSLSPLPPHCDAVPDGQSQSECTQMLSIDRKNSKSSLIAEPIQPIPKQQKQMPSFLGITNKGQNRQSEASMISISTNILDWDWPQPSTYKSKAPKRTALRQIARRDSETIAPFKQIMHDVDSVSTSMPGASIPGIWKNYSMSNISSPTAPPQRPLPPIPQTQVGSSSHQALGLSSIHQLPGSTNKIHHSLSRGSNLPATGSNSRINKLAASRGLQVDSGMPNHVDVSQTEGGEILELAISPLRLKFNNTIRSAKVTELRKRHISMLVKDSLNVSGKESFRINAAEFVRRGSVHDRMQAAAARLPTHSPSLPRRRSIFEKVLPPTPGRSKHGWVDPANYARGSKRISLDNKRTKRRSLQKISACQQGTVTSSKSMQTFSQSEIMILVDTNPMLPHGFKAGVISPPKGSKQKDNSIKVQVRKPTISLTFYDNNSDSSRPPSRSSSVKSEVTELTVPSAVDSLIESAAGNNSSKSRSELRHDSSSGDQNCSSAAGNGVSVTAAATGIYAVTFSQDSNTLTLGHDVGTRRDDDVHIRLLELRDEIDRMKRVYEAMARGNKERAENGWQSLKSQDLLWQDRKTPPTPRTFEPTGHPKNVLDQIEADLANSPLKADSDSDRTIRPVSTDRVFGSCLADRISTISNSDTSLRRTITPDGRTYSRVVPPSDNLTPTTISYIRASRTPMTKRTFSATDKSTLLSRDHRGHLDRFTYVPNRVLTSHSKLSSIISSSNPYPSTQPSMPGPVPPQLSPAGIGDIVSRPLINVEIAGGQRQDLILKANKPEDVDMQMELDIESDHLLTNTSQMDRALDNFKASPVHDLVDASRTNMYAYGVKPKARRVMISPSR